MLVLTPDVLVVELSVARSVLKTLGNLYRDSVVGHRAAVKSQRQPLRVRVVGRRVDVGAWLQFKFLIH